MSSQTKSTPPDLMNDFRTFVSASSARTIKPTFELTKTALNLLKHLPASRFAVLHYLKAVFDTAALNHIIQVEKELNTGKAVPPNEYEEAMLSDIYNLMYNFLTVNSESWAPIISTWSLELLGELSSLDSSKAHVADLNESLHLWMNCKATKLLVDLNTQCLSSLMHSNTEACINTLLNTSVKHSPYFDWVVAHVGGCFPQTVIDRVLSCGLKDFIQNKPYREAMESPKLKSVIGILAYLTTSHSKSIQTAVLELFEACYHDNTKYEQELTPVIKKAIVPYLIQILISSEKILTTVCDKVKDILTTDIIMKLYNMSNDWFKYFGSNDELHDIIVDLVMKCSKGGEQILELILTCISMKKKNNAKYLTISNWARGLLENVLEELDYKIRFYGSTPNFSINFLNSIIYDINYLYSLFLSEEDLSVQTAARICIYIGVINPPMLVQTLSFLLQNAKQSKQLAYLIRILNNELIDKNALAYGDKGGHFSVILQQILSKDFIVKERSSNIKECNKFEQMWRNILLLLKWERTDEVFMLKSHCISKGIEYNMTELTSIFNSKSISFQCSHILCEILDILDIPNKNSYQIPLQVILNYVHGVVNYFFLCCSETDEILRICGFKRIHRILRNLSMHSKISRNLAIRLLIERSLFSKDAALFGAKIEDTGSTTDVNKHLLTQNKKISKTIHLTKHSSVYNGGIIGNGKRKSISIYRPPIDLVAGNTEQLIVAIRKCCATSGDYHPEKPDVQIECLTLISLMLVQLISPDVMYNGLPWPEEEFSKVTIERDLLIRRLFNTKPLLWDLLNLVALHRPSLCYCSVLLRAVTATLIHQWTSMGNQSKSANTESYKNLMSTTIKVIDVMALGQLLPTPLCNIRDVLFHLNSQEIVSILRECIWSYMRDHIPSPALFNVSNGFHSRDPKVMRPPDVYTKTLRTIMQRNITSVGHLYARMFISTSD